MANRLRRSRAVVKLSPARAASERSLHRGGHAGSISSIWLYESNNPVREYLFPSPKEETVFSLSSQNFQSAGRSARRRPQQLTAIYYCTTKQGVFVPPHPLVHFSRNTLCEKTVAIQFKGGKKGLLFLPCELVLQLPDNAIYT